MIPEYAHVRIKASGITGVVVDISITSKGLTVYIVESDEKGVPGGYGDPEYWKLFDCIESEIEEIK